MADTLVAGIPFPVSQAAAVYFNSLPADKQAEVRAQPLEQQHFTMLQFDFTSTTLGYHTYADTLAHGHASLGPLDFSGTPLAGPAGAVNNAANAASTTADLLRSLTDPATWVRIAEVLIGGVLIVVALGIFAKPVTQPIISTVGKV